MSSGLTRDAAALAFGVGLALLTSGAWAEGDHAAAGHTHLHAVSAHGAAQVDLAIRPHAGQWVALAFSLAGPAGEPVTNLVRHHARKLHVVVISADMAVIGHIHPADFDEPVANGRATVHFTFPRPGRYLVAADFMTQSGPGAAQFLVEVDGEGASAALRPAVPGLAIIGMEPDDRAVDAILLDGAGGTAGYQVSLARPGRIVAGEPVGVTYRFALDGRPVADLRPYLDAPLHLAIVKADLTHFLHAHGSVAGEPVAGHDHAPDAPDHAEHGYDGPATFGPALTATLSFPEPGRYYLFGEAAHGDRLLVSRFPVEVR